MPNVFIAEGVPVEQDREDHGHKHANPFSSYIRRPHHIRFENQTKKEEILLLLRPHMITNVPWMLITIFMVFLPTIFTRVIPTDFVPANFRFITIVSWYLLTFAFAYEKLLCWLFSVGIVTNERVVDVDFSTILYKDVSEARFDKIQDVSVKTGGFIRSVFNFGDVFIQTAGEIPEIEFEDVPDPARVTKLLDSLISEGNKR